MRPENTFAERPDRDVLVGTIGRLRMPTAIAFVVVVVGREVLNRTADVGADAIVGRNEESISVGAKPNLVVVVPSRSRWFEIEFNSESKLLDSEL